MAETRIADSVHGTVVLDEHEAAIVSSRAFQRLRNVKHLGLASLVFPGADYSRFSHGVGTMHVTGMTLASLRTNVPGCLTDDEVRLYRMAALLHDLGHYPFSHTFERALRNHYSSANIIQPLGDDAPTNEPTEIWLHEKMGREVLLRDAEISAKLGDAGIDPLELANIIERVDPPKFANLVSSDLDADRTDYLMRTARHTGLPYGNVDLPYLLSQIRLDRDNNICFTRKGMRAAEHLLLCRYFDYQQVSFHKTVAGLEIVLNEAVEVLFKRGYLDCSSEKLREMVAGSGWHSFDDAAVVALMREALAAGDLDPPETLLIESVLHRRPPKLVANREHLGPAGEMGTLTGLTERAREMKPQWEEEFGAPFYWWTQDGTSLTKIASSVPVSALSEAGDEGAFDKVQQSVRILRSDNTSRPIQENPRSLMSVLSDRAVYNLRIYALLDDEHQGLKAAIAERVNSDLGSYWKED